MHIMHISTLESVISQMFEKYNVCNNSRMTSWICVKLLENIFHDTDFQNFYSIGSDKVVISWFLTSEILWIFLNYVKIKQFLMTSFPVDNDVIGGQACVALKSLGWTFISHKNFWISTIQFFSGSRYMRATFQFSITKKTIKNCSNSISEGCF